MSQVPESPPPRNAPVIPVSGSFTSTDTKKLGRQGRRKATPQERAVVVSKATAQATAAAKSILSSGGTHDTALSTARAAAESVLVLRNGDKLFVFSSRREAKQQASVVASMALLSAQAATNKFPSKNQAEATQFMQAPTPETTSHASSRRKPPSVVRQSSKAGEFSSVGGGSFGNSYDSKPSKPLRKERSQKSTQLPPSGKMPFPKPPMRQASKPKPSNQKNAIDDYFSRRRVPEVERSFDNLDTSSPDEEDPIFVPPVTSGPGNDDRSEADSEEHSLESSDEDSLAVDNTVEDNNEENQENPTRESLNIGKMLYERIFCSPFNDNGKGREKDDFSRDHQSPYSRHSDESSQDDDRDDDDGGKRGVWMDHSTKIPKTLEVQTRFDYGTGKKKMKIKSAMKAKSKESIEKVVLRAMHSDEPAPSMYTSFADTSMSGNHRSVRSKKSTLSKVKNWMKRKPKRGIR
jgi:hypothetical protein